MEQGFLASRVGWDGGGGVGLGLVWLLVKRVELDKVGWVAGWGLNLDLAETRFSTEVTWRLEASV